MQMRGVETSFFLKNTTHTLKMEPLFLRPVQLKREFITGLLRASLKGESAPAIRASRGRHFSSWDPRDKNQFGKLHAVCFMWDEIKNSGEFMGQSISISKNIWDKGSGLKICGLLNGY